MVDQTNPGQERKQEKVKRSIVIVRLLLCILICQSFSFAHAAGKMIVVDQNGKGDFKSIQEAVNSVAATASEPRVIFVRNGVYREKVFIDKDFISLIGEDRNKTIITISLARDVWRCEHPDDWGVAAVNLKGNDIVLENLTITNSFGFDNIDNKQGIRFDCPNDTANPSKTTRRDGHQMALRSFTTTRLTVRNCTLRAYGGDTVSPWNTDNGMFYFSNCLMEGGVDFYCPRGWAYAENCEFVAHGNVAAIWHDGSKYKDSKTVLVNCRFRGDDGFKLARYHRDAQFYLINCSFANNMADAPVYLNPSNPQNVIQWGHRVYFYNSHREGGDYAWHKDNLETAEGSPKVSEINLAWTFGERWKPSTASFLPMPESVGTSRETNYEGLPAAVKLNTPAQTDAVAENMLAYQRAIGGWPKAVNEIKVDYNKPLSDAERKAIRNDSLHKDATIDNAATMREIRYLAKAYKTTGNKTYLQAAEKGIRYYLKAQYQNGGWPQYFPDSALYRSQITYNDDAMMNVMNVLQDVIESKNDLGVIDRSLIPSITDAVNRGVQCILKTQIVVDGKLTVWCAQYNRKTLQPEMARKFELASLSGSESVGITRFLMRMKNPSAEIKNAITAAVNWFEKVKISGYKYLDVDAPNEPKGKDRVIIPEAGSTIWARFYEIGTDRPFFTGRDSVKKYDVKEIEYERRTGYAWYGTWPEKLLRTEFPAWAKINLK